MRFKGFEEEWERKRLGEVAELSKGKGISKKDIDEKGETECIRYGELYTHYAEVIAEIKSRTNVKKENLVFSEANDVIIPSSGETQIDIATASCVLKTGVALGGDLNIIKTPNNGVFLSYYLNNRKKSEIANLAQGISVVHLYASQLVLLEVAIPHITEQAKIASFLSLIGERIQTQNKIIEELELLKDIVLKKILTRKLRFSEFTDEWNIMILGELCEKQASNISANKIEDNFGDYIIYGASGELKKIDFYEVEDDYISIVKDGAGAGRLFYCKGKSSVLGTLDVIKPNKNVNTYFLYCLLSCIDFSKHTTGSTIPHIYFKDYANERIEIPTIEEQQKISIFFSSIDTKMETEKKVLQQYESQKKYLLQNMFI